MTGANESEMIARILAGEADLFHELIRPYERMVYLSAFSILKNETDAEDAAQEAIISSFRHLSSYRGDAKFSTWLLAITINQARAQLRRAKVAVFQSLDDTCENLADGFTPAQLTEWREIPLAALERGELRETLRSAVRDLPEIYRQVFTLRDLEELDGPQTASLLGISVILVKVRLHRARILLQKRLVPLLKATATPRKALFGRNR
jgi:RNA polymerase sigma-70 factor (ECF subfamily)